MPFLLIYVLPILLGFVFGYFFATPALIVITVLCVIIGAGLIWAMEELASLIAYAFVISAVIGNVVMWVTHYIVTQQSWVGEFLRGYVLR